MDPLQTLNYTFPTSNYHFVVIEKTALVVEKRSTFGKAYLQRRVLICTSTT
ncbi:hypothetical protein DPMN_017905 [Dreissena polymorpha]|uniref:Uncharacterized protein n=1 Tax=Dreissena polymorpha TaxID=45954 RepID=A0A9D4NG62_DREPO|nr:hypothetical protein DPMN_017905 [Dreissena polymorpha]